MATDVWLIDEGHPGHRTQSEGILAALERTGLELRVARISCTTTLPGFLRPLARAAMGLPGRNWPLQHAHRISSFDLPAADAPPPDFIISSGGRSAYLSHALARATGSPNVFVGPLGPFPPRWFTVVMPTVDWPIRGTTLIPTGITPSRITPAACRAAAAAYWKRPVPPNCWTILIGGNSASHRFESSDWQSIVDGLHALAKRYRTRWLIATSRRTGAEAESFLRERLDGNCIEDSAFVCDGPKKVVMPYLGSAQMVFVTQDSRSMIGEAVASGRPVALITPAHVDMPADLNASALEYILSLPQVVRIAASHLSDYEPLAKPDGIFHEPEQLLNAAAAKLRDRLSL
jgi:mitochondrial fission protein ELM1